MEKLNNVIAELKVAKNQFNNFGGYKYRSCEDILEAVKPLLIKNQLTMTISDDIIEVGGRVYVKATVTVWADKESRQVTAYAREAESRKGMDESQITGSASSYARKYALNGMFLIDDTKDADAKEEKEDREEKKSQYTPEEIMKQVMDMASEILRKANLTEEKRLYLKDRYKKVKTQAEAYEFLKLAEKEAKTGELTKLKTDEKEMEIF